jgi:mono/diheme cytochrome c family protein
VKPAPADISTPEAQAATTDGGIFWKLTTGREPMPPFGKKLSERERWVLVHYVRSLKVGGS